MESKTKNKQPRDILIQMINASFPDLTIINIAELKEGFFNVAYDITLSNDQEVILKIAPPLDAEILSYEIDLMRTEVESMRLVKETTTVPVPYIYCYDDTHSICNADYFIMEKLHGVTYSSIRNSLSQDKQYHIDYQLGEYNHMINIISNDTFGIYSKKNYHGSDWMTVFLCMLKNILDDAKNKNTDLGYDYDSLYQTVKHYSYALKEVTKPKLVHWDLWEGNVFVEDNKIIGIIDFERAMWADPLMEYFFRNHINSDGFLKGYGDIPNDESAMIRRCLYDIYLYTIMITECDYRHYSDDSQRNWAKEQLKDSVEKLIHF
ncbi:phosphotransferase [Anaeromicropila herbilytica]|uniref:Aminoglycoside phosphotransferase n=1 Tax=Anaeromicropila herbilytica TaxID=2785025 RepID=A0A7R7ICH1_9FIRM|nr:phosphotransferase [Anaeromicropila herbilytica]BCN29856.1 aminoglycoside phosphotransferase [Anaeromicropila herbilytica]